MSQATSAHRRASPRTSGPSIMLVDDHPMWRESLKKMIDRSGIGRVTAEASDGDEAVDVAIAARPDLIVMDMALPTLGGVEATRRIRAEHPNVKVLVLSSLEGKASVLEAVRTGASGYLLKTAGAKEVADAIRRVCEGELVFPPRLARVVLEEFRRLADAETTPSVRHVALAGDSSVHREGLARVLTEAGFEIAGIAGDEDELAGIVEETTPDMVIVDFHATPDKGLRVAEGLRARHPDTRLLVLGQESESSTAFDLIAASSSGVGYLLRDRVANIDELSDAIRRVGAGESVVDPAVVNHLVDRPGASKLAELTERERAVLALMAEGRSNQAISERLFLSGKTLEKHIKAIFTKLGLEEAPDAHRRVQAVLAYLRS